jgi:hypothetical protein
MFGFRYRLPIRGQHYFLLPQAWYPEEPDDYAGLGWIVRPWLFFLDVFLAIILPLVLVIFVVGALMRLAGLTPT